MPVGEREQLAVLFAPIANFANSFAFMAERRKGILDWSRETLIKENFHLPKRARISAFASSNAAMAVSRLTPGK